MSNRSRFLSDYSGTGRRHAVADVCEFQAGFLAGRIGVMVDRLERRHRLHQLESSAPQVAGLLGTAYTASQMTHDLRRLRRSARASSPGLSAPTSTCSHPREVDQIIDGCVAQARTEAAA